MIKATRLHDTFRRSINRINSKYLKSVSVVDVDGFLTDAYFTIYENLAVKSEVNGTMEDKIRQKLVRNAAFKIKKNKQYVKITYPDNLYKVIRRNAIGYRDGCLVRDINPISTQSTDLNRSLSSPFWEPSFEWEETLAIQDSDGLIVYTNGDFDVKEVILDYYTKPLPIKCPSLVDDDCYGVSKGSYVDSSNNEVTADSDFELDSTNLWIKVAKLAAINALRSIGDVNDYRTALEELSVEDKIFL